MNSYIRKFLPVAATSLVAFTSALAAQTNNTQLNNIEHRLTALEQRRGSGCCITPPARPFDKCGSGFFVDGGVLYWQATESGLDYAVLLKNTGVGNTSDDRLQHPSFEWDWGFKIGVGYNTPHDGWDVSLLWTRFHPEASSRTSRGDIEALLSPFGDLNGANYASASWKLRLDLLDLELGREFYVSKWLTLRPFTGLRSAWIHQRIKAFYSGPELAIDTTDVASGTVKTSWKNNFWGMGLRLGLDTDWEIASGFSIFADMAGSILLGHFNLFGQETAIDDTTGSLLGTVESERERFRAARFVYDLDTGFRYRYVFCEENVAFMAQLGWEQHIFINQNQLEKLVRTNAGGVQYITNQGDLSTQGVTLMLELDF